MEVNPLGLLGASGDLEHYRMFESMTGPYFADFARGDAEAARHVIDFYGGPGSHPAEIDALVRRQVDRTPLLLGRLELPAERHVMPMPTREYVSP